MIFFNWPMWWHLNGLSFFLWFNISCFMREDQGFFFPTFRCSQTHNHPQEDLPKFGYGHMWKEIFLGILFFILIAAGTCGKSGKFKTKNSKSGELGLFVSQKSFVCVEIIFFRWNKPKIQPKINHQWGWGNN